jgi:(S)-2-hydroxy-acid oxidase
MSGGAPVPQPVGEDESPKQAKILSISDLQVQGSKKLPKMARGGHVQIQTCFPSLLQRTEFYNSGSTDQLTVKANSASMDRLLLRSRVMVNVANCDTSTMVWGQKIAFPLGVAPAGIQAMAHPDGELATVRACKAKGNAMGISSFANYHISEIRANGTEVPLVMQLYTMKDRQLMERMMQRAEKQGCKAIFLTADSPVLGVRYNERRNNFRTPLGLGYPNLEMSSADFRKQIHDSSIRTFNDDGHSWERDIPWIRSKTKMEIYIKGIICAEDVDKAIKAGCDGVIVSNHGGRQLDGVPATIDALPDCVAAAEGRIKVHIDGGLRRGDYILRALALGAECVWVGRPTMWGLAVSLMLASLPDRD